MQQQLEDLDRGKRRYAEKTNEKTTFPIQILLGRASAVTGRRITSWAMARPTKITQNTISHFMLDTRSSVRGPVCPRGFQEV
jgi:hypothetical protein